MSKILITGITGFVGKAVCKRLRQDKDHMLTGSTRTKDLGSGPERVPLYHIPEIGPNTDWTQAVSGADVVIHLAARVHIMKDRATNPLAEFRKVNTEGTIKLAKQAAVAGVKRFIFISTVKVAGERSPEGGFTETETPKPEDAYGISKWEAEQALTNLSKTAKMDIVILRPPLVYGPGVKGNFSSLMSAIKKGLPLPLGAIQNHRSLLFVDNLADAIAVAVTHPGAANQTFFISDKETISTPDLIRKTAAALGRKPRLINLPIGLLRFAGALTGKTGAVQRLIGSLTVNTDLIQTQLEWQPPFSIETGLKNTADWFKSNA